MPQINLVIACWGGPRRTFHINYDMDRAYYLELQDDSLSRFKHNLSQVTFVNNGGDPKYLEWLNILRDKYVVLDRENVGMSYGAFNAAWQAFPDFDYYIFLEDDYLFVLDNFDSILVDIFDSSEDCGYLCQLVLGFNDAHPAIMNGMASRECLLRIGELPGARAFNSHITSYYGQAETEGQQGWGHAVRKAGMRLYDTGERFKAPYVANQNEFICWHDTAREYLIVPAQIYRRIIDDPNYIAQYQTSDEDWRQFKNYYFWLRNVYLSDAHRKSLEVVAAPFRIRDRSDLARVASIYERSIR